MSTHNSKLVIEGAKVLILASVFVSAHCVRGEPASGRATAAASAVPADPAAAVSFSCAGRPFSNQNPLLNPAGGALAIGACEGASFALLLPSFCSAACFAALPTFYPQAIAGLKTAKSRALLKNKKECKKVAGDASRLAELLYKAKLGPMAGAVARAVAGRCGRCACDEVF